MKLVILDRDGVINYDSPHFIKTPDEWQPLPGSLNAIVRLQQHGYRVAVATNQSGLGRGLFDRETLLAIHAKMLAAVHAHGGDIDIIAFCPHHPDENCACRKPKPGLLIDILHRSQIAASEAIMVGDSLRDIQAGLAVGCKSYLVLTGKGQETLAKADPTLEKAIICQDLAAVVDDLLAHKI